MLSPACDHSVNSTLAISNLTPGPIEFIIIFQADLGFLPFHETFLGPSTALGFLRELVTLPRVSGMQGGSLPGKLSPCSLLRTFLSTVSC